MADYMFVTRLILNDGFVLENCKCGYYNKNLTCFLYGFSFSEAFQHFSDQNKYKKVTFEMEETYVITRIEYSGFDQIISIMQEEDHVNVVITGSVITIEQTKIPKDHPDSLGK